MYRVPIFLPAARITRGGPLLTPPATQFAWFQSGVQQYQDVGGVTPSTSNGQIVRLWKDQSGNGRHASVAGGSADPVLATNAVNGQSAITNTTLASWLTTTAESLNITNITMAIVYKSVGASDPTYAMPLSVGDPAAPGNTAGFDIRVSDPARNQRGFDKGGIEAAYTGVNDTTHFYRLMGTYDGTNLRFYSDGVLKATSTNTTQSLITSGQIGLMRPALNNYQASCYLAEAIVYNRLLNAGEITTLENYLIQRFGAFTDAF